MEIFSTAFRALRNSAHIQRCFILWDKNWNARQTRSLCGLDRTFLHSFRLLLDYEFRLGGRYCCSFSWSHRLFLFAILVLTGFFFELRLSAIAGGMAALSFAIVYVVARPVLIALPIPDPTTHGVITGIVPNSMKAIVIFSTGLFVGVVAR